MPAPDLRAAMTGYGPTGTAKLLTADQLARARGTETGQAERMDIMPLLLQLFAAEQAKQQPSFNPFNSYRSGKYPEIKYPQGF